MRLQDQVTKLNPGLKDLDELPAILPEEFRLNFILKHGIKRVGPRGHLVETRVSQSAVPNLPRSTKPSDFFDVSGLAGLLRLG